MVRHIVMWKFREGTEARQQSGEIHAHTVGEDASLNVRATDVYDVDFVVAPKRERV